MPKETITRDSALIRELELKSDLLASNLAAKRHFIKTVNNTKQYDPRLLVFEFIHNIMLRGPQISLVEQFMEAVQDPEKAAAVHQLIMGSGKTTVVAPLLALMLADGNSLVLQAVPPSLLEFTRSIMRERFSSPIIRKPVFTFAFDRFHTVDEKLLRKLVTARDNKAIVVTTPAAIKAFILKFIELLHVADKLATDPKSLPKTATTSLNPVAIKNQAEICTYPKCSVSEFM